jgi:hypothetical protein
VPSDAIPALIPAPSDWTWGPEQRGFGGYAGRCTVGPFTFTVSAKPRFQEGWELHASVTLAQVRMATYSWEAESMPCTPDGITAEVAKRDVARQLTQTARRRVADAARLLEEYDVLSRACRQDPSDGPGDEPGPTAV